MSFENNTITSKQPKIAKMVADLVALFKDRPVSNQTTGKHVVLALEDTPPIARLLAAQGCFVDLSPFNFVKTYLDHRFNGDSVDALLMDFDIGQDLNGVDVTRIIRAVEKALKLHHARVVPNSTDHANNELIAKAGFPEVTVPSVSGKLGFFQGSTSKPGFFARQPSVAKPHHTYSPAPAIRMA